MREGVSYRGCHAGERHTSHSDSGLKEDLDGEPRNLRQLQELSVDVGDHRGASDEPCGVRDQ